MFFLLYQVKWGNTTLIALLVGVRFQDCKRKAIIREQLNLTAIINIVAAALGPSAPWISCGLPRRSVRVKHFRSYYPPNGPSDLFLLLGRSRDFSNPWKARDKYILFAESSFLEHLWVLRLVSYALWHCCLVGRYWHFEETCLFFWGGGGGGGGVEGLFSSFSHFLFDHFWWHKPGSHRTRLFRDSDWLPL
jgi:hypothetical protein